MSTERFGEPAWLQYFAVVIRILSTRLINHILMGTEVRTYGLLPRPTVTVVCILLSSYCRVRVGDCILVAIGRPKSRSYVAAKTIRVYHSYYLVSIWWYFLFSQFQLLDVVFREETLWNVIQSVTRNGRSIILTAVLALILVYMFSIIGFLFLKDDFMIETDPSPNRLDGMSSLHSIL